ncbi:calmodulin-binding transcription activator 2-like isoform X3 [Ornithodoros turicata]|uniref:calmodulin-binding transcription activator 2-like isoform X3 n=1 Tax=Ornithodoros turicata TaxID=34597 RepID=UPI003138CE7C
MAQLIHTKNPPSQSTPCTQTGGQQQQSHHLQPAAQAAQLLLKAPAVARSFFCPAVVTAATVTTASTALAKPENAKSNKDIEEGRPSLPESLETIPKADYFPTQRHRWNTNEEIAAILISFDRHEEWLSREVKIRPKSGSMLLYSRKRVRYRRDGYCWKKRKDGKTTREDHMKLKVQGTECIYGCYVHSAILPTFHRRCYWLLQNPDIVLVHYLNVPYSDDNKMVIAPSLSYCADKKEWTKEELVSQLKPMFYSENEPDLNNELEISTAETVEAIVQQLMEKQRAKNTARTHECPCDSTTKATPSPASSTATTSSNSPTSSSTSTIAEAPTTSTTSSTSTKKCAHTLHRIISPKTRGGAVTSTSVATQPSSLVAQQKLEGRTGVILAATTPVRSLDGREAGASTTTAATTSFILNLSQLQGGGGLLILNSAAAATGLTSASVTPVTLLCGGQETTVVTESATTSAAVTTSTTVLTTSASTTPPCSVSSSNSTTVVETVQATEMKVEDTTVSESRQGGNMESTLCNDDVDFGPTPTSESAATKDPDLSSILGEEKEHTGIGLFDDSLDLSHDGIQKTLSANLIQRRRPSSDSSSGGVLVKSEPSVGCIETDPVDLNPMDFIDNDISTPDEEVFNLDTFDMLTDLPNWDDFNSDLTATSALTSSSTSIGLGSSLQTTVTAAHKAPSTQSHYGMTYREGTANITDYSPDWSYTEGGVKVLITGPWYSSSSPYTILFDGVSVPTTLVQSGVLRCFCPAHEAGLVTLQVACEGFVISNSVIFEYREQPPVASQKTKDWFGVEESALKFSLLERLEMIEARLMFGGKGSSGGLFPGILVQGFVDKQRPFEERLVSLCQELQEGTWVARGDASPVKAVSHPDLTLLHLAAALGFARLACALLRWRHDNSSLTLEAEVDALRRDRNDCTPLHWACGRGHREVALLLHQWNSSALKLVNAEGQSPTQVAHSEGHSCLAEEIEQAARKHQQSQQTVSTASLPSTASQQHCGDMRRKLSLSLPLSSSANNYCVPSGSIRSVRVVARLAKRASVDSGAAGIADAESSKRSSVDSGVGDTPERLSASLPASVLAARLSSGKVDGGDAATENADTQGNSESPFIDVVGVSDEEVEMQNPVPTTGQSSSRREVHTCELGSSEAPDSRVLTLAEQIIAALPDRIKAPHVRGTEVREDAMEAEGLLHLLSSDNGGNAGVLGALVDDAPQQLLSNEFSFEFSDHNYRYCEAGTPSSSPSPASSSCLQSPGSFTLESPSPPPTTADFCEFFKASGKIMEQDFSNLTLSDKEQRELYEAAKIIQKAYRSYKGRKRQEEQEKEKAAAILIQSYYRRYKQYMYYKQITRAAAESMQQGSFHGWCSDQHKRFKKSPDGEDGMACSAAAAAFFRSYSDEKRSLSSREGTPTSSAFNSIISLRRTYSQRRQHQAARKIQQFMRQSKNNMWEFIHGKVIAERACLSCRKREAGNGRPTAPAPKIPGTAF